jgi:predicted SAM-dependent methyltransferase
MSAIQLNIGCGANLLPPPWRNLDLDRPDEVDRVDITKPLPFPNSSVSRILIEHCLEHVDCSQGMKFLLEAHRVLLPGGVIRVCVPELGRLSVEEAVDICINHGHRQIYSYESLGGFLRAAGFHSIIGTARRSEDGHHRQIGMEKDDRETLRMEATK